MDTLRKDAFDDHFDWLPGTRFENAWSTSHWTVPAHASLFTGKYGSELGVHAESQRFDCDAPSIAESLSAAGYRTRAFSCNINISKNLSFDRGFDEFEGNWRVESVQGDVFDWDVFISETRDEGPQRYFKAVYRCVTEDCDTVPSLKRGLLLKMRDLGVGPNTEDDGVSEAIDYVEGTDFADEGEFLFVNLMEAHTPYDPPEPYRRVEQPEVDGLRAKIGGESYDDEAIRKAYDSCVEYLSDRSRELFAELRSDFDVVLTVSDHGEMLGEHGAYEHMYGLYPQLTNVPLAAWSADDTFADDAVDATASILDVHATVADLAGVDVDSRGRPLHDLDDGGQFLTEYHGITTVNYNSVVNAGYDDVEFLHDRLSGYVEGDYYGFEDFEEGFVEQGELPEREDDEAASDEAASDERFHAEDGRERLAALRESVAWKETGDEDVEIDERTRKHLEDLGYA
ncbi:arylsulfatase [Halobacteriales archaeon QS_1_68_20]|nr:MAG: arylsulfatase [Halobacteriales archaeon QS_1_68_20]